MAGQFERDSALLGKLEGPDANDYVQFMLSKEEPDPTHPGTAHHLCLETPDVPAAMATLKANSYDPDGTRTELMEPKTIDGKPTQPPSTALPHRPKS
jgi:hypothetical protein